MVQVIIYPVVMVLMLLKLFTPTAAQLTGHSILICSTQKLTVLSGDDVILPCHLEPPMSVESMRVEWTRPDLQPEYIHVHQDGRFLYESQNPSYNFRTRLFVDQLINGNVSLKLFRVTPSDTEKYRCYLPSIHQEAVIQLSVVESEVTGSHEPVRAVVGDDVILPCHLEPPFDVTNLTVEWKFSADFVHVYRSRKDDTALQDEKFKHRAFLFHSEMHKGNISLKLTNVTETDAGNYTCYVPKLPSQVRRGNVTLIVDPVGKRKDNHIDTHSTDSSRLSSGAVAGIVIACLMCLVAPAAAYVLLKRQNISPTQDEPNTEGEQEVIPLASGVQNHNVNNTNMDNTDNVDNTGNVDLTDNSST